MPIHVVRADITTMEVDAIVNAANSRLAGGGGVDGAIHRAAGPSVLEECRRIGGCPVGQAVATGAGRLRARYVIHTVGPVWRGGNHGEPGLLADAYRNSLELAARLGCRTVAFPNISTGVYRFPKDLAARISVGVVADYLDADPRIQDVWLVCFDEENHAAVRRAVQERLG